MANDASGPPPDLQQVLRAGQPTPRRTWQRRALIGVLLLAIGVPLGWWWFTRAPDPIHYVSAPAQLGDLTVTVTATGTLEPVNQVDVGSELSGTIQAVLADYNDHVRRGQVLARLDTDRLNAQVIEGRATLQSARAKVDESHATVLETRLRFQRCEQLAQRQLCSREDLETARAAYTRAQAGEANAKAQVAVAQATLDAHQTDLAKTEIRSPIDGVVLRRQIEPGQTVAASLQTPVLFSLAENLAQMQLHVAVDEADVGKVHEQQHAVFAVDAYPNRNFPAQISQVRFAPQTSEGVVSYETILEVDNQDLSLRPGMTATAEITVAQRKNVLLVPNAALRFTPPEATAKRPQRSLFDSLFRRGPRGPSTPKRKQASTGSDQRRVWTLHEGTPAPVAIRIGATDGTMTEVVGGALKPGTELLVDATGARQ